MAGQVLGVVNCMYHLNKVGLCGGEKAFLGENVPFGRIPRYCQFLNCAKLVIILIDE